jgi:hypothetical protein
MPEDGNAPGPAPSGHGRERAEPSVARDEGTGAALLVDEIKAALREFLSRRGDTRTNRIVKQQLDSCAYVLDLVNWKGLSEAERLAWGKSLSVAGKEIERAQRRLAAKRGAGRP